jgi:uncharacterized protein (DUF1778 family)
MTIGGKNEDRDRTGEYQKGKSRGSRSSVDATIMIMMAARFQKKKRSNFTATAITASSRQIPEILEL